MAGKGTLTVKVLGDKGHFDKTMGGLGRTAKVAFAAVGAAAVVGATKSLTAFVGFERQMNEVFTLLPGISQDAMADMTGQVKDFSKEFGVLPDEVVPALYQSLSAGVPKDNVFEFLETAQMAAKGGVTDLTTAVDGISSVVNAYGSDVIDATKASDLMFTAVRLGKTNFEELSASLSNVTPIASGLGVSFEDVSAGLAALTAKGTPTAQATTQMRSMFVELSKAGGETAKVFEEMAGKSFQDFIKEGGNTSEALAIMQKAADESGVELQDLFGSVEAGAAALSLASDTTFGDNIDEMGNSAGATKDAFDQMMTGLGPVVDKIKAWVAVLLIDIGAKLAPVIEAAMQRAGEAFAIVSNWWDKFGPGIMERVNEVREAITGWINDVSPKIKAWVENNLQNMANWWDNHGPKVIAVIESVRDALLDAVDLMVDAVQFIVDEWDKFKVAIGVAVAIMIPHWVALAAAAVTSAATQVAAWIATHVQAMASAVIHSAQVVIMIAKWVALGAAATFRAGIVAAAWVITSTGAIAAAIVMGAQVAIMIGKWVLHSAAAMANAAIIAAAWLISMGPIVLVVAAVAGAVALIIIHWETLKQKAIDLKNLVVKTFDALVAYISRLPGRIADAAAGLWDGIPRPPGFLSSIPGIGALGNIPGFDSGGVVPGRRGSPQLVLAHGGETILPTHKSGMAGSSITVNVDARGATKDDADAVGRAVASHLRMAVGA